MTCIAGSINCIGNVKVTNRRVAFNQQINDSWLYSMLSVDKETALNEFNEIMNAKEIKYWR
jgi:hypothetical protein